MNPLSAKKQDTLQVRANPAFFFKRQFQHLLLVLVLVPGAWVLAIPNLDGGAFLGISDRTWLILCLATAVVHQVIGWLVFRGQLCFAIFTRWFGEKDLTVWGIIFLPFLAARPLALIGLAVADGGSLGWPRWLGMGLGLLLLMPTLYTGWSISKYFGLDRALGADHFRERYRHMGLVTQGIFAWSDNAMYMFAFFGLWAIALMANSRAALAVALFQHAYIWVHMFCTEEPDIQVLYQK